METCELYRILCEQTKDNGYSGHSRTKRIKERCSWWEKDPGETTTIEPRVGRVADELANKLDIFRTIEKGVLL